MEKKKVYTAQDALAKAMHFCAYQERAQQEVRDKLYTFGLSTDEVENVIVELIAQNFLNEERFAKAYVRGKVNIKKWGRKKVELALKQKQVSSYCIKKGMKEIDLEVYYQNLTHVLEVKLSKLKGSEYEKDYKATQYALSRGYELDLIQEVLKELKS